jgi:hypothetical protein
MSKAVNCVLSWFLCAVALKIDETAAQHGSVRRFRSEGFGPTDNVRPSRNPAQIVTMLAAEHADLFAACRFFW